LFSTDGAKQISVTYSADYQSSLTGRHLIADLVPGTYDVYRDAVKLLTGVSASPQGVLSFQATGGGNYTLTYSGVSATNCDVNGDGSVDVRDVQLSVNMALGLAAYDPRGDPNQDGSVNVVDVQRVIAAALGNACVIGP